MRKGDRLRPPPMDTLEAFDAAARLGSFSAAAAALHLTPGAVSRQMAALEGDLGVALFTRAARRRAHAGRPAPARGGVVRISVTPSFGARWLLPRFCAEHPRVEVVPVAETRLVDLAREGFDLAVRYTSRPAPEGVEARPWLREELVPVAAPALLDGRPRTPDGLMGLPFLHDTSDTFWRHRLTAAGRPELLPDSGTVFNDYSLAVGAAVSGLGLLVGRTALIEEDLREGRLVVAAPLRVPSPRAYHLVRPAGAGGLAAAALWAWLLPQGNIEA